MIRSRFLFLLLLVAHVSLTPAGVYTCACFVTGESGVPAQAALDHLPDQIPGGHTAVCTLLAFLSLSFLMAGRIPLNAWFGWGRASLRPYRQPKEFIDPPPTPPPHFA